MPNPTWVNYLKVNAGKYPLEVLKQGLLKAGATAAEIEEAVQAAAAPPSPAAAAPTASMAASAPSGGGYSHPEARVRHSYPVHAMEDGFFAALALCLKTMPFILLRLGLMVGFTVASIVWFFLTLGLAAVASKVAGALGFWAFLIGFGAPAGVFVWFRKYVLYMLKMAHVAVLTRLITHGELEPGINQVQYGKDLVAASFGEINALFVLDALIGGVVRGFINTVNWIAGFLPIPGLDGLMGFARKILENATTYIDETIFSYNLARKDENQWRSSRDGLIYYAQNWQPVLKTAVYAWVLEYFLSFTAFMIFMMPLSFVGSLMPRLGGWAVLMALLFAMNFKSAVLRPIFLTMVALTFHKRVQHQEIDPQFEQTLGAASDKFKEISERARRWAGRPAVGGLPAGIVGRA